MEGHQEENPTPVWGSPEHSIVVAVCSFVSSRAGCSIALLARAKLLRPIQIAQTSLAPRARDGISSSGCSQVPKRTMADVLGQVVKLGVGQVQTNESQDFMPSKILGPSCPSVLTSVQGGYLGIAKTIRRPDEQGRALASPFVLLV